MLLLVYIFLVPGFFSLLGIQDGSQKQLVDREDRSSPGPVYRRQSGEKVATLWLGERSLNETSPEKN